MIKATMERMAEFAATDEDRALLLAGERDAATKAAYDRVAARISASLPVMPARLREWFRGEHMDRSCVAHLLADIA